jgi:hypothetical protein
VALADGLHAAAQVRSIPSSMSSTSIRFALTRRVLAMERTCAATPVGRLMLWRIVLLADLLLADLMMSTS